MIDLDKNKQYGIICISQNNMPFGVSWNIKVKGQQALKDKGVEIKLVDVPTHSAMLIFDFDNGGWWVYQSHWKGGVHKVPWLDFVEDKESRIYIYEDQFNINLCNKYLGEKYGKLDILGFLSDFFINIFNPNYKSFFHNIDKGYFCTEYVALCQLGLGISKFLGLPCSVIEPALHKYWCDSTGKTLREVRKY